MAIQNIVRMADIPACIEETIRGIRDGVAAARKSGVQCEMPPDVDFDMIVVQEWQSLEAVSFETGRNTESQGGGTTETQMKDGKESTVRTDTGLKDEIHTRATGDTTTETKSSKGSSDKQNNNAHNERNSEEWTNTD